jgi:hypothetical protein
LGCSDDKKAEIKRQRGREVCEKENGVTGKREEVLFFAFDLGLLFFV